MRARARRGVHGSHHAGVWRCDESQSALLLQDIPAKLAPMSELARISTAKFTGSLFEKPHANGFKRTKSQRSLPVGLDRSENEMGAKQRHDVGCLLRLGFPRRGLQSDVRGDRADARLRPQRQGWSIAHRASRRGAFAVAGGTARARVARRHFSQFEFQFRKRRPELGIGIGPTDMGFLSKIYERRGKARRQASIKGFLKKSATVDGKDATRGGGAVGSAAARGKGNGSMGVDANTQGPASADKPSADSKQKATRNAKSKPDTFDFETSRDAALKEAPMSPSTRSPLNRTKPKVNDRARSSSPATAGRRKSPGSNSKSPSASLGVFGAARDAKVPSQYNDLPGDGGKRDTNGKLANNGKLGTPIDPFLPTPGKRRRVTFAEVDAFTLDEEDDEDEMDVPAYGRRSPEQDEEAKMKRNDPFSFGDGDDEDESLDQKDNATQSPGPKPAWGVFGGSPATSPVVDRKRTDATGDTKPNATVHSPEWAKRSTPMSRSPSASPMDASGGKKPPINNQYVPAHSPSAAMAEASPSPAKFGNNSSVPESSDQLAALDEAQYALSGLSDDAPVAGRLACASSLVAICADARYRRALAQHGLAPRVCRAALDLCASVVGVQAKLGGQKDEDAGVIARALKEKNEKSPALGLSAAALLYLSTLELRASEATVTYAERDVAGILAGLMRHVEFRSVEGEVKDAKNTGARKKLGLGGGGFGALLADSAEAKAMKTTRDALRSLKFLPHEAADAPTLALLAAHRALAQIERTAARASQRDAQRRSRAETEAERKTHTDGHDDVEHEDDENVHDAALEAKAEAADEAAIAGWGNFKERLASRGAMLECARLADEAAREIVEAGGNCFSRPTVGGPPDEEEVVAPEATTTTPEKDAQLATDQEESKGASRAMARLFRCMRVAEAATFGSSSCAEACVSGSLAPGPNLKHPGADTILSTLVPMRTNDAIASPAPAPRVRQTKKAEDKNNEPDVLQDVVGKVRVTGIELSPAGSSGSEEKGSTGTKRRKGGESGHNDDQEEDEVTLAKRFRTAEALLLTPSPGAKKSVSRAGLVASAIAQVGDIGDMSPKIFEQVDTAMGSPAPPGVPPADTPTFNFSNVAAAVDASIAWLDDGPDAQKNGDVAPWTMVHTLLRTIPTLAAAAATATHATSAGGSVCGVVTRRSGGLGADPRLAAGTLRAAVCVLTNLTNENPTGCAAVRNAGGLETAAALVPWCAALEGLLPCAGPDAKARKMAAARAGGSRADETKLSRRRGDNSNKNESNANAAEDTGHDMLNAALCFLVNIAEMDQDSCKTLRALEADAGAMEGHSASRMDKQSDTSANKKSQKKSTCASVAKKERTAAAVKELTTRHVGLVELLASIFVRSGGAGPVDEFGDLLPKENDGEDDTSNSKKESDNADDTSGEVTAEMLTARDKEGNGLITQAYAALLVAFLVENQPALRADLGCTLPKGGFESLAGVLERFRTFHESLESISEESRASLQRVIRWLRGN